ncbi:putative pre-rRNA processing protein Tsr1 [Pseudomassariella vexata]|uniref:Putative pre-rRNA processing protein Tsr1 n=1 Tax=Pseudomassariella vexata TaxID=1141098 RepID=A0A1Y2DYT9_9PEZI|nr:putative pre-rRNA processing protein Tsr1 [Pseudomassariella vexata]ORY64441.1 putative pre-rRNA processing protein Tsr1 [Pseudomassariella vexata]
MPSAVGGHSHRPTSKVSHKAFKSKKATKGALRELSKGKVPNEKGQRKTPHQQVMSKIDRRNQAKQRQLQKTKDHEKDVLVFKGRDGAPRIVAVIPLCANGDVSAAIKSLNGSLDIDSEVVDISFRVSVDRFKQKLQYVPLKRDLTACMDAARVADFVIFLLSAEQEVDPLGELIIRCVENQGMSTCFTVVQNLDQIQPAKARPDVVKSLVSFMTHFHPDQDRIYSLDARQECSNLMRSLCGTTPKGIYWRDQRSWMLADGIEWPTSPSSSTVITGVVRGKGLKADRLVHVGDWGTFQIEKITAAPLATKKRGDGDMAVDEVEAENILETPGEDQDDLAELAPEEVVMEDMDADTASIATTAQKGVLLDDHHYFSEDEESKPAQPKKLPKGTSNYQAAWYLEDVSDSESDMDDEDMQDAPEEPMQAGPEDGIEGMAAPEPTEVAMSEYPQSERFEELDEDDDAQQLAAYRARKHDEAEEDMEFPDEIELHPHVLARERLAKYRGLKSLRTSPWNTEEDRPFQPEEWSRLLQISDYKSSRNRAINEALVGGVTPGTRVHVYLKAVPMELQKTYKPSQPITLFSLLRHENKKTSLNFDVTHKEDYEQSIKAKEELIVQCGPRRFIINPLFSMGGNTENDVHKFCRFLHPGQSAVASFMGPITWGAVPTLFFKRTIPRGEEIQLEEGAGSELPLQLVATGTARAPSTSRVVAKRVVLTGHPYHIHKKIVTIRYMFFNWEDVEWFKALPMWTKRGRSGFIREALGTHGYFKATFDGKINPQDSVGVSLYKRVWPRSARPLDAPLLEARTCGTV